MVLWWRSSLSVAVWTGLTPTKHTSWSRHSAPSAFVSVMSAALLTLLQI